MLLAIGWMHGGSFLQWPAKWRTRERGERLQRLRLGELHAAAQVDGLELAQRRQRVQTLRSDALLNARRCHSKAGAAALCSDAKHCAEQSHCLTTLTLVASTASVLL